MPCWHNAIPQEKYPRDIDLICLNSQCNKSESCMRQDTKEIIEEKESDVIAIGGRAGYRVCPSCSARPSRRRRPSSPRRRRLNTNGD